MKIDGTITVGDLLMSVSILISMAAVVTAWWRDRLLRRRELADRIRNGAAKTLAKLERWQELSLSLFQDAQPLFVETSEHLADRFEVTAARDYLWKSLNTARIGVLKRIVDEQIETAYADLYGYHPEVRDLIRATFARLKEEEELLFARFLEDTQNDIFSMKDLENEYHTAQLGNALRETAFKHRDQYDTRIRGVMGQALNFLAKLILTSDRDLLRRNRDTGLMMRQP